MSEAQNINLYRAAYKYLTYITPKDVVLENYFLGDNRDFKDLKDIYVRFIFSAQNYQYMPNVIKYKQRNLDEILLDYNIQQISELSPDKLYEKFRNTFRVATNGKKKMNCWYKWNCSIIDSAKFVSGFKDASDFDEFVKRFNYNTSSKIALPLLIANKIKGIGFALACDLLKELGYTYYPKPDVHMIDVFHGIRLCEKDPISVFEAIERMTDDCRIDDDSVTPYKVDKVFWLICSGNYYKKKTPIQINGRKKELIDLLKGYVR
jgi:hypothetical protein